MPDAPVDRHARQAIPDDFLLSIVVPVYNERDTLETILRRVHATPFRKEIVVVDDASTDGSNEILQDLLARGELVDRLVTHPENRGKGAALRSAFDEARGHVILIQDADLEYDPADYGKLLAPIIDGRADVVYGSRFLTTEAHRVLFFWHSVANRGLTLLSNMLTNLNLTDMETCYKVFRHEVVRALELREERFGIEPEMTAKIASLDCSVFEVGISYDGRKYDEGKKIGWKDAVRALWCIFKYRLFQRPRKGVDWSVACRAGDAEATAER